MAASNQDSLTLLKSKATVDKVNAHVSLLARKASTTLLYADKDGLIMKSIKDTAR